MIKKLYSDEYCFIEFVSSDIGHFCSNDFVYYADLSGEFITMSVLVGEYLAERFNRSVHEGCNVLDRINKIRNKNNI